MSESKIITIFLVDDNAFYLKNLEISFSSKPYYNIKTFPTGESCVNALDQNPDIIILDYYLNSISDTAISGLETLIKIRQVDQKVPVIILSTESNPEVAKVCMNHKATEYIVKSDVSIARLREIITGVFIDKQIKDDLIVHVDKAINESKE